MTGRERLDHAGQDSMLWVLAALILLGMICVGAATIVDMITDGGIDAHTVRVTATVSDHTEAGSRLSSDYYTFTYSYEGRTVTSEYSMPSQPYALGEQVCLEIDAEKPSEARPCGTGIAPMRVLAFLAPVGALEVALVVVLADRRRRRKRDQPPQPSPAAAGQEPGAREPNTS